MFKLRDYQQEAVTSTLTHFRKTREPALIVLPTGAGKSIVVAELTRLAKGRVLILAHVKELVEQNHEKYSSLGLEAGIYSAGLGKKDVNSKAIFGSIQSVARAPDEFFKNFSLVIIDECHRISEESESQYQEIFSKLRLRNPELCILGLTATPYRMGLGWIYEYSARGEIKTQEKRFFKTCVYELPLDYMIHHGFLTRPVKIDIPVTSYNFSELTERNRLYTQSEVDELLHQQRELTPLIVKNIIDITERYQRRGTMIFCATVKHAQEILGFLPEEESALVIGETASTERDQIIERFKNKEIKYLVNVSVLTTGFDAPHVDVIAILRPTESNSLYQQIIGRGLRLHPEKEDCFVLDYTGMGHDIMRPEISDRKPAKDSVPVQVECPRCQFINDFWGYLNLDGEVVEHFGRKCRGAKKNPETMEVSPCEYRFRIKLCPACETENDLAAKECFKCHSPLTDPSDKLKQARLSRDCHILKPDRVTFEERIDKNGRDFLEVRYFDHEGQVLREAHFFSTDTSFKRFQINFLRSHLKRPELVNLFQAPAEVIKYQKLLRLPAFVIARKQEKFWKITEKVFAEELE
jgi:DNA repair protein RadD